ncbi:GMC oxidoreductase [Candidatus Mycobacterium methanotrophicum]|uniref:GMC oxidoreductase n=1 Tax=Candidatus Mycobacterium methanotrophicum TaxID=2943498 RepID=UPI003515DFF2
MPIGDDRRRIPPVLDLQCRVNGIDGLWAVDGSILPTVISRGPTAMRPCTGSAEFVRSG